MTNFLGQIYYYSFQNNVQSNEKPETNHLLFETDTAIYFIDQTTTTKILKTTDKGATVSTVETRLYGIQWAWHDQDNGVIYFVEQINGFDFALGFFSLTLSDDSITEMSTLDHAVDKFICNDIFMIGSDVFVIVTYYDDDVAQWSMRVYKWVDPAWTLQATLNRNASCYCCFVAVVGTKAYTPIYSAVDGLHMCVYDNSGPSLTELADAGAYTLGVSWYQLATTYDDDDIISFIANSGGTDYLLSYSITGDSFTIGGAFTVSLMPARNTDPNDNAPFNSEKGFDISLDAGNRVKIYTLASGRSNLFAIAQFSLSAGDVIRAVSDSYVFIDRTASGGDVELWEYVDFSSYVLGRSVIRAVQRNYWSCEMYIRTTGSLGDYNIFDGMFIQIIGNLSAQCNTGTLSYFGSPDNFNDETVGTQGTSIAFVDSATLYDGELIIVSSWQSHKNVLRLLDDVTAGEDPTFTHNMTASTANTVEFYVGTNDVTELWLFGLYDSSVPDYIVKLRITASNLDYLDSGDAWQSVQAVANDTLYHVKIIWRADNTFDVYVDETIKVTNQATNNNQSSGVDQFIVTAEGDSTDYLYFDAWGDISDADYYVGRNLIKTKENTVLYEGYARYSDLKDPRKIWIDSPALRDLKNKIFPGSYSGRTDEILSSIFDESFNYITAGTMSNGTAMGTVYFRGSKKGKRIINNYAQIDSFTWVIKPNGLLNYNDGSVESHITITEADKLGWYEGKKIRDIVNQVNLKGAINPATGKPFESTYNDTQSQQIYGVQPVFRTFAQIADQTILDNLAQSICTVAVQAPFQYKFMRKARFEGLILPIETLNFAYSPENISASDRVIHSCEYYFRTGEIIYQIIDAL